MTQMLKVEGDKRDSDLAIFRKEVTVGEPMHPIYFETPSVAFANMQTSSFPSLSVNEVIKHVDLNRINILETEGTEKFTSQIQKEWQSQKLNLVLFNLRLKSYPDEMSLQTIAHSLYSASHKMIMLPFVPLKLLQEQRQTKSRKPQQEPRMKGVYTNKKIDEYLKMMSIILDEIEKVGNNKEFIGTIPLIPAKFSRSIVDFYIKRDIHAFAIDAGTHDLILNDADLRIIISSILSKRNLEETLIYACNLGFPKFDEHEYRADDFLSIFACIDILGSTFKTQGGEREIYRSSLLKPKRQAKMFSRQHYSYLLKDYVDARDESGNHLTEQTVKIYNKREQLKEADEVRQLVGQKEIKKYLATKNAIDKPMISRLETIAKQTTLLST
jgi:hypothetical protein